MSKTTWKISAKTPFGFDHYELCHGEPVNGVCSGAITYGQTETNIESINIAENYIKTTFFTDIPISEQVSITLTGLENEMFGYAEIGPHTKVEIFATRLDS